MLNADVIDRAEEKLAKMKLLRSPDDKEFILEHFMRLSRQP